jgi:O-methyltransferase domain
MQIFEYFNKHPNELELFAEAMRSFSAATGAAVVETYDFSGIRTLADIGGRTFMRLLNPVQNCWW